MNSLNKISIAGFRSIKKAEVRLNRINILLGANGAGKSNLIDLFRLLNYALTGGFQDPYLRERGPASSILHFGSQQTGVIRGEFEFETDSGKNYYRFTLADSAGDRLTFTKEEVEYRAKNNPKPGQPRSLIQHPSDNSGLSELWAENDSTARFAKNFLQRCRVYQFHDTSIVSHFRDYASPDQSLYLYADGGNLAAVLLGLREQNPEDYTTIIRTLQTVLPWFDDFILQPEGNKGLLLRWRMKGRSDYLFGPGHLSDGSLRIMALVTLLSLPPERLPNVIIIDEPELGLHPAAERIIADLMKSVSNQCQIIASTQSASFIDHFSADDIIVAEHNNGESTYTRQSADALKDWLQRYTLSQIWNKDIIGGRP